MTGNKVDLIPYCSSGRVFKHFGPALLFSGTGRVYAYENKGDESETEDDFVHRNASGISSGEQATDHKTGSYRDALFNCELDLENVKKNFRSHKMTHKAREAFKAYQAIHMEERGNRSPGHQPSQEAIMKGRTALHRRHAPGGHHVFRSHEHHTIPVGKVPQAKKGEGFAHQPPRTRKGSDAAGDLGQEQDPEKPLEK